MALQNSVPAFKKTQVYTRFVGRSSSSCFSILINPSELNISDESTSQSLSLKHSSLLNSNNSLEEATSRPALPTARDGLIEASLKIGVVIRGAEFATRINTLHKFYEVNRRVG